ncbi:hypothetical protein [Leptospira weilii]|uniref:hypothetical protein n=1 Tax=Leptospira weilii TaxID=28184 RepID=UPI001159CFFD|nr:hypothetical protein [Leptospira weilii]QDK25227.1 hypothetical protein FHG67_21245 [Leptospira weilii]QDK29129.1 hypothetical protein FHG68_21030 [Leptospira weilii]
MIDPKFRELIAQLSVVLSPHFYNKDRSFEAFWIFNWLKKNFWKRLKLLYRICIPIHKRNEQNNYESTIIPIRFFLLWISTILWDIPLYELDISIRVRFIFITYSILLIPLLLKSALFTTPRIEEILNSIIANDYYKVFHWRIQNLVAYHGVPFHQVSYHLNQHKRIMAFISQLNIQIIGIQNKTQTRTKPWFSIISK